MGRPMTRGGDESRLHTCIGQANGALRAPCRLQRGRGPTIFTLRQWPVAQRRAALAKGARPRQHARAGPPAAVQKSEGGPGRLRRKGNSTRRLAQALIPRSAGRRRAALATQMLHCQAAGGVLETARHAAQLHDNRDSWVQPPSSEARLLNTHGRGNPSAVRRSMATRRSAPASRLWLTGRGRFTNVHGKQQWCVTSQMQAVRPACRISSCTPCLHAERVPPPDPPSRYRPNEIMYCSHGGPRRAQARGSAIVVPAGAAMPCSFSSQPSPHWQHMPHAAATNPPACSWT